jgi:adenosylmethionine-8-amino-7-oxononanoate aminotransferase
MEPIISGTKSVMSGHTLSANPQSCAVSLAVIEYLEKNEILKHVKYKGNFLKKHLQVLKSRYPFIGDIRGKGLLLGLEFVSDPNSKTPFPREAKVTEKIVSIAKEIGLLLYPSSAGIDGINGDSIIIAPPLTITEKEMKELILLLNKTLAAFSTSIRGGT